MSLRQDGSYRCDHCGGDLENGGVFEAAVISDIEPGTEGTQTRILHLCRVNECVQTVLTAAALAAYPGAKV